MDAGMSVRGASFAEDASLVGGIHKDVAKPTVHGPTYKTVKVMSSVSVLPCWLTHFAVAASAAEQTVPLLVMRPVASTVVRNALGAVTSHVRSS